jgi:transcriptional regulator with XRE-family HTH domain
VLSPREQRFYEIVGIRVRERREGRFTQERLARSVGVQRTSITNLEHGKQSVPLHYLLRLAEALDCELTDLLPSRDELQEAATDEIRIVAPQRHISEATSAIIRQYTGSSEGSR